MNFTNPTFNSNMPYNSRGMTKKDIITYLQGVSGCNEYEIVSDFDTQRARHICKGQKRIVLLEKQIIVVPINSMSTVSVEVFFCQNCRKLLINSQSLEVL